MAQLFIQHHEHVQRRQLGQVERGVAVQDLVIEPQVVETDDEVGALQFVDQVVHLRLAVDFVFAARRAVGHAHAHAHLGNVAPAANFLGGLLRFQIEINQVLGHVSLNLRFVICDLRAFLPVPPDASISQKRFLRLNPLNRR